MVLNIEFCGNFYDYVKHLTSVWEVIFVLTFCHNEETIWAPQIQQILYYSMNKLQAPVIESIEEYYQ